MKKKLLVSALAVSILGTSTAFAATNHFSSVPKDHWAYSAVEKLVQDGLIDGYGDEDFRGEKSITRYEMAQLVAKAMSNVEKANAEDKASISKLEDEYASELKAMDIRLSKVEKGMSSFKWYGDARIRYQTNYGNDIKNTNTNGNSSRIQERVRLGFYGEPAENISVTGRLKIENTNHKNDGWGSYHQNDNMNHGSANLDLLSLSWNRPNTKITLGRQAITLGQGIIWNDNPVDGFYIDQKLGKNVKLSAGWGDLSAENWATSSMDAFLANLSVGIGSKTTATVGYLSTNGNSVQTWGSPYNLRQVAYGFNTQITPKVNVLVEGVHNGASGLPDNAQRNGWWSRLTYGNQNWSKAKTYNVYFDYISLGNWVCDSSGWGHIMNVAGGDGLGGDGEKGWGLGVSYMLAANTNLDVNYYKLKPYDTSYSAFSSYKDTYNVALSFSF